MLWKKSSSNLNSKKAYPFKSRMRAAIPFLPPSRIPAREISLFQVHYPISKRQKRLSLVTNDQYVAQHIPSFIVRADNSKTLHVYSNLLAPGVKIAIGNKDMCAIGKVGEAILNNTDSEENFRSNIVVTGSTVNELLHLVKDKEVDAALVWSDMLTWESAGDLKEVSIPGNINKIKEIRVAVLSTSTNPKKASQFADFVSSKGQKIFSKHGFGSK